MTESRLRARDALRHVVNRGAVLVASVHHTGTVFALDFLRGHPRAAEYLEFRDLLRGAQVVRDDVVHLHVMGEELESRGVIRGGFGFSDLEEIVLTARGCRVVIPTRDPLLALISRHARHPELDHSFIVRGFHRLAAARLDHPDHPGSLNPGIVFLPVDLLTTPEHRLAALVHVTHRLGWLKGGAPESEPARSYIEGWASSWPIRNTAGPHPLKEMYDAGDVFGIRNNLPAAYDRLIEARPVVEPFLRKLGYEDLPWWRGSS